MDESGLGVSDGSLLPVQPVVVYPLAEASHEEVVADVDLFHASLARLHEHLGIKDNHPRINGAKLDFHLLYKSVTELGGCMSVITHKQWRDAGEPFQFPDTITTVSYSLRKAYVRFLWDYEQVYFFRMTGPPMPPPAPTQSLIRADDPDRFSPNPKRPSGGLEASVVGTRGSTFVDARFDAGYFVTTRLGRHEFKGLLYFPPPEHTTHTGPFAGGGRGRHVRFTRPPAAAEALDNGNGKDHFAPKPHKTAFNFFSIDARMRARERNPNLSQSELTRKVGDMWALARQEDKAPYVAISQQDKQRYHAELEAYNYRLASQAASQLAVQAAQAVAAAQAQAASESADQHLNGEQQPELFATVPDGPEELDETQPVDLNSSVNRSTDQMHDYCPVDDGL